MGLLYPLPVHTDEKDFVLVDDASVTLKTYGLPYIFWGYAAASLSVLFFLWLAVRAPLKKLLELGDSTDAILIYSLQALIFLTPVVVLGFFFYEKRLTARGNKLVIQQRLFGLPVRTRTLSLATPGYQIQHHLDAPNVARLKGGDEALGFQNKGYFILWAVTENEKTIAIDRHSRRADLQSLVGLLESARKS
ncbi:MAG: hypothetical protein ACLGG7_01220 [Bacteriovoracia bacterium]